LIIIGGHEAKEGETEILDLVAKHARRRKGNLLIFTIATQYPEKVAEDYTAVFRQLGVEQIDVLDIASRDEGKQKANIKKIDEAAVIFFTGGDQLRITSQLGDTPMYTHLFKAMHAGVPIVGTSAGAAVMPQTMIISGHSDETYRISALGMAPGLGLIDGVSIDSHFAQRGRMGRLIGVVTQNPANLGLGIDENTAIVVEDGKMFSVLGEGAVYVLDGSGVEYSSLSERSPEGVMSVYGLKLHVLARGDRFDLVNREPIIDEEEREDQHERESEKSAADS
jgi:cyanophycinase